MTEETRRPKKFILRRVIVVAAVMALLFALAMGANAATGGELFGKLVYTLNLDDGVTARVYQAEDDGDKISFIIEEEVPDDSYKSYTIETDENGSVIASRSYEVEQDENGGFVYKEVEGGTSGLPEE